MNIGASVQPPAAHIGSMDKRHDVPPNGITISEMTTEFDITWDDVKALRVKLDTIQDQLDECGYAIFRKLDPRSTNIAEF